MAKNTNQMLHIFHSMDSGIDVVELCGGAGRVSRIAIRRHLKTGENFDLVTHCDLNDKRTQDDVEYYITTYKPLVIVMAPSCTPFGAWARYNYYANYQGWLKSYQEAAPHGRFCGRMALKQTNQSRYWLNEQPEGSWLYYEAPWPEVINHPSTVSIVRLMERPMKC